MRSRWPVRGMPGASTGRTRIRSSRPSSRSASDGMRSGRWSTTSSRSTPTARTRRCSTARSRAALRACASATAYGSCPKPYNHPVRSAESAAVLDLISDGRVDFGTGRSSTRAELEGFGIDPEATRGMWQEAIEHVVGAWTNDEYAMAGKHWQMPRRRVLPKPLQRPHPPLWGATSSEDGHRQIGDLGLGLCSFAVGVHSRGDQAQDRRLPGRDRALQEAAGKVGTRSRRDVHHDPLRANRGRSTRRRARVVRVVPEGGRTAHRESRRVDGGGEPRARQLRLRRRSPERGQGRRPRSPHPRLSRRRGRLRPRNARPMHRVLSALRGRRRRPPALPGEPLQDPLTRR